MDHPFPATGALHIKCVELHFSAAISSSFHRPIHSGVSNYSGDCGKAFTIAPFRSHFSGRLVGGVLPIVTGSISLCWKVLLMEKTLAEQMPCTFLSFPFAWLLKVDHHITSYTIVTTRLYKSCIDVPPSEFFPTFHPPAPKSIVF